MATAAHTHTHARTAELAAAPAFSHAQVAGLGHGSQPGAQCGVSSSALFQPRLGPPLSSPLADGGGLGGLRGLGGPAGCSSWSRVTVSEPGGFGSNRESHHPWAGGSQELVLHLIIEQEQGDDERTHVH